MAGRVQGQGAERAGRGSDAESRACGCKRDFLVIVPVRSLHVSPDEVRILPDESVMMKSGSNRTSMTAHYITLSCSCSCHCICDPPPNLGRPTIPPEITSPAASVAPSQAAANACVPASPTTPSPLLGAQVLVPKQQSLEPWTKSSIEYARFYLHRVKITLSKQPQVLNNFVNLMKQFKSCKINEQTVLLQVSDVFKAHPKLIDGFTKLHCFSNFFSSSKNLMDQKDNTQSFNPHVSVGLPVSSDPSRAILGDAVIPIIDTSRTVGTTAVSSPTVGTNEAVANATPHRQADDAVPPPPLRDVREGGGEPAARPSRCTRTQVAPASSPPAAASPGGDDGDDGVLVASPGDTSPRAAAPARRPRLQDEHTDGQDGAATQVALAAAAVRSPPGGEAVEPQADVCLSLAPLPPQSAHALEHAHKTPWQIVSKTLYEVLGRRAESHGPCDPPPPSPPPARGVRTRRRPSRRADSVVIPRPGRSGAEKEGNPPPELESIIMTIFDHLDVPFW